MNATAPASRSTFVTVLGCILITLSALTLISSLSRGVLLEVAAPELLQAQPPDVQPAGEFLFGMFRGLNLVSVTLAALLTYAAYAFIRRRNWARRTFLVLFALGIAANVLTLLMFGAGFGMAGLAVSQADSSLPAGAGSIFTAMFIFYAFFAIATVVLLGWLVKRLRSPAVKAEFGSTGAA